MTSTFSSPNLAKAAALACLTVGRGTALTVTNTVAASLTVYNKHNTTSSLAGRAFSSFLEPNLYSPQRVPDAGKADAGANPERQSQCSTICPVPHPA